MLWAISHEQDDGGARSGWPPGYPLWQNDRLYSDVERPLSLSSPQSRHPPETVA